MEVGYKTRQRALILQFLSDNRERHLSVDEVFDYLRAQQSPVGKSTVYRCLDRLVSQGRARRYFLGDGARACYQYVDGQGACREHFHLKCIGCGQLFHVSCERLDEIAAHVLEHHGFQVDHTKTVLYGLCAGCAAKRKETEGRQ